MSSVLVIKTGALGDVLRTTSVLPGLARRDPGLELVWVVAPAAKDLVAGHPLVARVVAADPARDGFVDDVLAELGGRSFDRVLSFDDERPTCRLAARVAARGGGVASISGAYEDEEGVLRYTPDVAPWFDMGLLSVHGKERADELKKQNRASHPRLFADMLGVEMGEPRLDLAPEAEAFARAFREARGMDDGRAWIGLNTGAGGRWESKKLSVERTVELAVAVDRAADLPVGFLLLGGPDERERNAAIHAGLEGRVRVESAGNDLTLPRFAAVVDGLDVLVTSDSLALHVGVARRVPTVCFFAPTSAAEIELYGRGTKVASTSADACSYRPDADTSTLTVERLLPAVLSWLGGDSRRRG
ncbi:MAG: glycosyltransferase family 9 protein [Planctomycetota bacterium]